MNYQVFIRYFCLGNLFENPLREKCGRLTIYLKKIKWIMKYLHWFETEEKYEEKRYGDYIEPWTSFVEESERVDFNKTEEEKMLEEYLTFEILTSGNLAWLTNNTANTRTIQYSKNGGQWTSLTSSKPAATISVSAGDTIRLRGDNPHYSSPAYNDKYTITFGTFNGSTCTFNAHGNIMSLIDSTNFSTMTEFPIESYSGRTYSNIFAKMFETPALISASGMILGAKEVGGYAYQRMFKNATNLVDLPKFPQKVTFTGYRSCYYMFQECQSLTNTSNFPSDAIISGSNNCFQSMFSACFSLSDIPVLPTALAYGCYEEMFTYCYGLTSVTSERLPATVLPERCYLGMFSMCSGLTTAPDLPAPVLTRWCYSSMFSGCTSLNHVKCLASENIADSSLMTTSTWMAKVSGSGTFIKKSGVSWPSGTSGIPNGWTVQDA